MKRIFILLCIITIALTSCTKNDKYDIAETITDSSSENEYKNKTPVVNPSYKDQPQYNDETVISDGETIHDLFSTHEQLYKKKRTSYTDILSITVIDCNVPDKQYSVDNIKEFYERFTKFEYMNDTASREIGREQEHQGLYQITFEFTDGEQNHFYFERIRRVVNSHYTTDDEFEEYLNSFINEKKILSDTQKDTVTNKNQLGDTKPPKTLDIVEKGYAYYKEIPGYTLLMADKDFELRFEITKEIKDEIMQNRVPDDQYIIPATDGSNLRPDWTFEEYIENIEKDETVVSGHFEQVLGTHVIKYKLHENSELLGLRNFSIDEEYTLIPFVIDKVYGESDLKTGETIMVRYERSLNMNFNTKGYTAENRYTFFDDCTLDKRTYIASLKLNGDGTYCPYSIFQRSDPEIIGADYNTWSEFLDDVCNYYN